jgi:copper(I)-binding protein
MKKLLAMFLAGMFMVNACGATGEEGTDIEAHDAWARTAFKDENTAVYLLMHNHSGNADEISSVSSDIAETAEIHKSEVDANGVVQMTLQTSMPLPVDAEIAFEPGGLHIMLTGLKKDLNVGDTIALTLHFKVHPDIVLSVPVLDAADPDHTHMDMDAPTP